LNYSGKIGDLSMCCVVWCGAVKTYSVENESHKSTKAQSVI